MNTANHNISINYNFYFKRILTKITFPSHNIHSFMGGRVLGWVGVVHEGKMGALLQTELGMESYRLGVFYFKIISSIHYFYLTPKIEHYFKSKQRNLF